MIVWKTITMNQNQTQKNTEIRHISADLVHDVRTPLVMIRMAAMLLEEHMPTLLQAYDNALLREDDIAKIPHRINEALPAKSEEIIKSVNLISETLDIFWEQMNTLVPAKKD